MAWISAEWVEIVQRFLNARAESDKYREGIAGVNYVFTEEFAEPPEYIGTRGDAAGFGIQLYPLNGVYRFVLIGQVDMTHLGADMTESICTANLLAWKAKPNLSVLTDYTRFPQNKLAWKFFVVFNNLIFYLWKSDKTDNNC